ncbi:hypothetical protein OAT25_00055 [Candidatus Pelagibacter sp.]|nr:hypothetical protein [Candidatus Pelagibacter sp.]
MNIKPIIIVAGSPRSIFLEIFFKAIKKKINSPIILICDKKNFFKQYKRFNIKKKINILDIF